MASRGWLWVRYERGMTEISCFSESENIKKCQKMIIYAKSAWIRVLLMLILLWGILLWSFWELDCCKSCWNKDFMGVFMSGVRYGNGSKVQLLMCYDIGPPLFSFLALFTPLILPPQYFSLELCSPHGFKHFKVIPGNFEHISDFKGTPT